MLTSQAATACLDERWPRIIWVQSPDGKTRIPGEREAVAPRLYIFRKSDWAQLTSDDEGVRVSYGLRTGDSEAVYAASVTCDGEPAVDLDIVFRLTGADLRITFEGVREHSGFCFLAIRFPRLVAASSRDEDARVVTCYPQGRVLDPPKCKPNLIDYSWHGAMARLSGAAYRARFMATLDLPGYEDLLIQEVRQYSRIGFSETLASLGAELMFRQRTVENPQAGMPPPSLPDTPPIALLDEPLRCAGPKEIRLHFIRSRGKKALDWTDAARYFQSLIPATARPEPLYDDTLVYKIVLATRNAPRLSMAEALAVIRRLHHLTDGMKQVCYWVGFQHFGHDTGWPDVFTVYPPVGDKAQLRKAIREAREKLNTEVSFHLNFDVFSDSSPLIDGRYLTRDSLGRVSGQGNWDGNLLYGLCIPAYRRQLARIIERMVREYGIRKTVHLDTMNGAPYLYDASPAHPYSAYELQQAKIDFLMEFRRRGLDVTSECLTDPYLGHVGHTWALFNYAKVWEGEEEVPFANFIYHGAASWNAGHGAIPLTYFGDKPRAEDAILGMLLQGGGAAIEFPDADRSGAGVPPASRQDACSTEGLVAVPDQLYLIQPPYAMLRNRKWTGYRVRGSAHRVDYGPGSHIEVDPAKPGYEVVVDGKLVARDFTTVFAGPKAGTLLAFSRQDCDLDWPAPPDWRTGEIPAVVLTDSGPGIRVPARVEQGRLRLRLRARQPVRLGPAPASRERLAPG